MQALASAGSAYRFCHQKGAGTAEHPAFGQFAGATQRQRQQFTERKLAVEAAVVQPVKALIIRNEPGVAEEGAAKFPHPDIGYKGTKDPLAPGVAHLGRERGGIHRRRGGKDGAPRTTLDRLDQSGVAALVGAQGGRGGGQVKPGAPVGEPAAAQIADLVVKAVRRADLLPILEETQGRTLRFGHAVSRAASCRYRAGPAQPALRRQTLEWDKPRSRAHHASRLWPQPAQPNSTIPPDRRDI